MYIKYLQTFSTPDHHPRSKPFVDHVFTFSLTLDGKIWFRNFQIVDETLELQEIGALMIENYLKHTFTGYNNVASIYNFRTSHGTRSNPYLCRFV